MGLTCTSCGELRADIHTERSLVPLISVRIPLGNAVENSKADLYSHVVVCVIVEICTTLCHCCCCCHGLCQSAVAAVMVHTRVEVAPK